MVLFCYPVGFPYFHLDINFDIKTIYIFVGRRLSVMEKRLKFSDEIIDKLARESLSKLYMLGLDEMLSAPRTDAGLKDDNKIQDDRIGGDE